MRMKNRIGVAHVFFGLFLLGVVLTTSAQENDAPTIDEWRRAADQGEVEAAFTLGAMYDNGESVIENDAEAVKWYRKAAEQGHAGAQRNLGIMYANGEGVPEDADEAVKWFRKAADQGDTEAQYIVRVADTSGIMVELILDIIFSFIFSWSVGLAPALIYRYGIYKRPIEKKLVFWRLAPVIVILMFAFKLTVAGLSETQPNGNPIPWIVLYYIGKWIMTREPRRKQYPALPM